MGYVCGECGNDKNFRGYEIRREKIYQEIIIDSEGSEVLKYLDSETDDSEVEETTVEKCCNCDSKGILWLEGTELEKWYKTHFDTFGKFIKGNTANPDEPAEFVSINKLKLLNDKLLKNELSIEEYRRQVQEIKISQDVQ